MSERLRVRVVATVAIASMLFASQARADDDPTTTAAARERFKEGVTFFDQKQYEKARAAFLQAYALKKHPAVLLNLAQSELRSGRERDAAKHFSQYLREATEASAAERDAAQQGLNAARAAVVEVRLNVDEAGAEVLVDGELEGLSPLPDAIYVSPGSHTIEARKGEKSASQSVAGKAGEKKELRLTLVASAPAAPAPPTDEAPREADEPAPEEPEAEGAGREPFLTWVTTRPAGFVPAGIAVLAGIASGGFAVGASVRYKDADTTAESINRAAREDDISTRGICVDPAGKINAAPAVPAEQKAGRIDQYRKACTNHQKFVDEGDTFRTLAIGFGVGAGAAAITTVVLYFVTAPRADETATNAAPELAIVPWGTPGESGGLSVLGRF